MSNTSSTSLPVEWAGPRPREYSETTLDKLVNGEDRVLGAKLLNRLVYVWWKNEELPATVLGIGGNLEHYKEQAGELRILEVAKFSENRTDESPRKRERKANAKYDGEYETANPKRQTKTTVGAAEKKRTKKTQECDSKAAQIAKILLSVPSSGKEAGNNKNGDFYAGVATSSKEPVKPCISNAGKIISAHAPQKNFIAVQQLVGGEAPAKCVSGSFASPDERTTRSASVSIMSQDTDKNSVTDESTVPINTPTPHLVLATGELNNYDADFWRRKFEDMETRKTGLELRVAEAERGSAQIQDKLN